jgi:hypothetical protein
VTIDPRQEHSIQLFSNFRVQYYLDIYLKFSGEEPLNASRFFRKAKSLQWAVRSAVLSLSIGAASFASAQTGAMSPYQGESDGVSAGGQWLEFDSTDKMTAAHKVRFELQSNNYFKEDPNYKPRVSLYCNNGKLKLADFNPGVRLPPPNRPGFWGQPQLEVEVRVDDVHYYKGWNWMRGHFLSMDKGTVRGMMGAQVFNIALPTRSGRQIAEFSPAGLNLDQVRQACDLTPKKPSKD